MSISLKIECSPGSDITDAFQAAVELANKLNICIDFTFNEVECMAKPNGSIKNGVDEYHEVLKGKSKYKFARAFPYKN